MDFWTIGISVYILTTIVAVTLTYKEQKRRGHRTPIFNLIGFMLCMVWPVVAAVMVIFYKPQTGAAEYLD